MIVYLLAKETQRFTQLEMMLKKISRRVLTQQLRELEQDGLVIRRTYAELPPRVEYQLTPQGQSLLPIVELMHAWGMQRQAVKRD